MDFRAALLDQTRDFGELIGSADPSTHVPTCPEWTVHDLVTHVGSGHRYAADVLQAGGPVECTMTLEVPPVPGAPEAAAADPAAAQPALQGAG